MSVTVCERCFPGWADVEVLTVPPMLPCDKCGSNGKRHCFRTDPVLAMTLAALKKSDINMNKTGIAEKRPDQWLNATL